MYHTLNRANKDMTYENLFSVSVNDFNASHAHVKKKKPEKNPRYLYKESRNE